MPFKFNLSTKDGKTYKLEAEAEEIIGRELHDKIAGKIVAPELDGYEFEIAGASDKAGFTAMENVDGIALKKILLPYGKAMHMRPKGLKKINRKPAGLRLRKTVRGKVISPAIIQINLKVLKDGAKKLAEIFPEQNQPKEKPAEPEEKK